MKRVLKFGCVMSSAIGVAIHSPAIAQQSPSAQEAPETRPAENEREIIVTAQRREERLAEVPLSISVLSGDDLVAKGATQFRDYADSVPGLSYNTNGAGYTQIVLRGVTTGYESAATVAIYVDDVPFGGSGILSNGTRMALDAGLFDLERIEVLRGPQGTLYGASAVGGLLKYVSRRPSTTDFEGRVHAGLSSTRHGGVSSDVAGVVNVPISEGNAGVRVSGFYNHDGGYIDNLFLGKRNVNRSDIYGGRIDLLLTPTEAFSARLTAYAQNISRQGDNTADFTFAGAPLDNVLTTRRTIDEPFEQEFRLVSATLNYDFGGAELTSISSYQTSKTEFTYELGFYVPTFEAITGRSYSGAGSFNNYDTKKFVQEVRLASATGNRLEWVVGGFYTDEKTESTGGYALRDADGRPAVNDIAESSTPSTFEEYAVFGTLTYHITDRFDVSGGIRYAHNRQSFSTTYTGSLGLADQPLTRSSGSATTYLANARYRIADRSTLYLRYATGYRPGGGNTNYFDFVIGETVEPGPFRSDYMHSYEAGFRHETADRRFSVDLTAYYIDWKDIIIRVYDSTSFASYYDNAAGMRVRGGELSLTARPVRSLTLAGAFAYTDAYITADNASLGAVRGDRMPTVPRFTANVTADYVFSDVSWRPSLGVTARYVGERRASFDANPQGFLQYELPDYTVVDLRAGLSLGSADLQFYVRNLFDSRGQLSAYTYQGNPRPAILQPRTIGVNLTKRF